MNTTKLASELKKDDLIIMADGRRLYGRQVCNDAKPSPHEPGMVTYGYWEDDGINYVNLPEDAVCVTMPLAEYDGNPERFGV